MKLKLWDLIKRNKNIEIEQLIALFSLQTGLKLATVREYLKELEAAGVIDKNGRANTETDNKGHEQTDQSASE